MEKSMGTAALILWIR